MQRVRSETETRKAHFASFAILDMASGSAKEGNVVVGRVKNLNASRLRRVLQDLSHPEVQDVLSEIESLRDIIANPLSAPERR